MKQIISVIVAMNYDNVIGVDNKLPWYIPEDLRHFKKITMHKPVIMGRKTFESIGNPLHDRLNIVISRNKSIINNSGLMVTGSLSEALELCNSYPEVFIIGGGEIFKQSLGIANKLYLTIVDVVVLCPTVFFPPINFSDWKLKSQREIVTLDGIKCLFKEYIKLNFKDKVKSE